MGFGTFAKLAARRTTALPAPLFFVPLFFSIFLLSISPCSSAYSLRLLSPAQINATLEYNDSASVSLSSSSAGCGETIYATVKANDSFYKKMFLQGKATAVHWQGECGFVRGHCGYNALSISNSSAQIFFSQSSSCLQLEDYSADFAGVVASENSSKGAQISFSALETHDFDSSTWGLPVSINSLSALLLREQKTALSGNSSLENSTLSTTLQVVPAKTGNVFAVLNRGATLVSFRDAQGNALPFSFNAQTSAFEASVVSGKKIFLSYARPSLLQANFSVAIFSNATLYFPPLFRAVARGTSGLEGGCVLSEMPSDSRRTSVKNALGKTVPFDFSGGRVSWDCDFSSSPNYSVFFESGSVLVPSAPIPQNFVVISAVEKVSSGAAGSGAGNQNESSWLGTGYQANGTSSLPAGGQNNSQNSSNSIGQLPSGNVSSSFPQFGANGSLGKFGLQDFSSNYSPWGGAFEDGWRGFENEFDENGVPLLGSKKRALAPEHSFENESEEGGGVEDGTAGGVLVRGETGFDEFGNSTSGYGLNRQDYGNAEEEGGESNLLGEESGENNGAGGLDDVLGLAFSTLASPFNAIAFAALVALAAIAFARGRRGALRVSKKRVGGKVCLEVANNSKEAVSSVSLSDFVSEQAVFGGFSETPAFSETMLGKRMQWKKAALGAGERWRVEYFLENQGEAAEKKAARTARVSGFSEKGEKLLAESG